MLDNIEQKVASNSLTNGSRPRIFNSIRRISYYDYYGEELMENFFPEKVLDEIGLFLDYHDVYNSSLDNSYKKL